MSVSLGETHNTSEKKQYNHHLNHVFLPLPEVFVKNWHKS
ncbi:hypothetical protein ED5_3156 [Enterobacter roggenkampii]|nr:hypothetical protein ED5_3156 [Enterobacter roggenkampii]